MNTLIGLRLMAPKGHFQVGLSMGGHGKYKIDIHTLLDIGLLCFGFFHVQADLDSYSTLEWYR